MHRPFKISDYDIFTWPATRFVVGGAVTIQSIRTCVLAVLSGRLFLSIYPAYWLQANFHNQPKQHMPDRGHPHLTNGCLVPVKIAHAVMRLFWAS